MLIKKRKGMCQCSIKQNIFEAHHRDSTEDPVQDLQSNQHGIKFNKNRILFVPFRSKATPLQRSLGFRTMSQTYLVV